jgi:ceramide glucosyltransferase
VIIPAIAVGHSCAETTFTALVRHELRWARTVRLINPKGFAGSIMTHAVPLALIGCLLPGFAHIAVAIFMVAAAARVWLLTRINRQFALRDPIWLVLPRDLLSFVVFVGALFATRVDWRGARFTVSSAGAIAPDQPVQD